MLSPENITSMSSVVSSNSTCRLVDVWPTTSWNENSAIFTTKPSPASKVVGLFRFWAPILDIEVDFAIGLRKDSHGRCGTWHMQRRSSGKLAQSEISVNDQLEANRAWPSLPNIPPNIPEHQWRQPAIDQPWILASKKLLFMEGCII
ncbi:hypothetical protein F5Y18DRAFT_396573 [Xylariaceae sp. FL1019]|nr:hypothetical protein F5Y18DRAFT_396573 [Xylariaceae sp. FL1019]